LLDLGFSPREVVLILYVSATLLGIIAVALSTANRWIILTFVGFSIVSLTLMGMRLRVKR
jgi:hypothetical protein